MNRAWRIATKELLQTGATGSPRCSPLSCPWSSRSSWG